MSLPGRDVALVDHVRTCQRTGLELIRAHAQTAWRVQKSIHGALNPLTREPDSDRAGWGRWDFVGGRTVYAAHRRDGAFIETLQTFHHTPEASPRLSDLFDDEADGATLLEEVTREWDRQFGGFTPGLMPAGWRDDRTLYELQLPDTGWFIDVQQATTLAALGRITGRALTLTEITGNDRALTTDIASLVRRVTLDDDSSPIGFQYYSRWGVDHLCYALWLDNEQPQDRPGGLRSDTLLDRGLQVRHEHAINLNDPDLRTAADIHNLRLV